jgi:Lrp/AsnC family transcriptional regulator, leucine-responsive regulatory protein
MEKLDSIDKRILNILQEDGRSNTKEIADTVGLSLTPTYERIKRLEKNGIIDKYVALVDKKVLGISFTAFCSVRLQLHSKTLIQKFEVDIKKLDEVMECYHMAGNFDYLLKIEATDMKHYQEFISNKLAGLNNISNVQSSFVMTEIKHETAFKL